MSRIGEKRTRSSGGRESEGHAPPRKLTRTDEESEEDSAPEFSVSQMHALSQDEEEAVRETKGMSMVSARLLPQLVPSPILKATVVKYI